MLLMHSGGKKTTTSRNFLGFSYDETYYAGNQKKTQVFGAFPDGNSTLMLVASGSVTLPARAGAPNDILIWIC